MGEVSSDFSNLEEARGTTTRVTMVTPMDATMNAGRRCSKSMSFEEMLKGVGADDTTSSDQEQDEDDPSEMKKTVEDVWRDIQGGTQMDAGVHEGDHGCEPERDLGEMTLEEFLLKSGVVREEVDAAMQAGSSLGGPSFKRGPEEPDIGYGGEYVSLSKRIRPLVSMPKFEESLQRPPTPGCGGSRFLPCGDGHGNACVHVKSEDHYVDKVAERKQRRMIKNRESAARSRARKQAYTAELEAEVAQLREENENLKAQLNELEKWRKPNHNKVLDVLTTLKENAEAAKATRPERAFSI